MGIEAALLGMLGIGMLFDVFSDSGGHNENTENTTFEGELTSGLPLADGDVDAEEQIVSTEQGYAGSSHLGNNEITSADASEEVEEHEGDHTLTGLDGGESDTFVLSHSTAGHETEITDYNASEDQILVEYDAAAFPDPTVTVETVTDDAGTYFHHKLGC